MVKSIVVARQHDGLPLASTIDDDDLDMDYPEHKSQSKALLKQHVPQATEPRCTVEVNEAAFSYHVYCRDGVAFVCLSERLYPKRLAYACLEEVSDSFFKEYTLDQIKRTSRPYELIRYTNALQRIKRSYQDVRSKQNLDRLQQALGDVTNIMTQNINQLLERGNKLESMSLLSSNLSADARRYVRDAQQLNWNAFMERYGVPGIIFLCFLLCLFIYFYYLR